MAGNTQQHAITIDCHCHTFNADDLPLKGFLKKVVLNADEEILPRLIVPLANLLAEVAESAPGFSKERNKLDGLLSPAEVSITGIDDQELAEEEPDEAFAQTLNGILYRLENSADEDEQALYAALEHEMEPVAGEAGISGLKDTAKSLLNSRGIVTRYIKWIRLLTRYRYKITDRIIDTYSTNGKTVDLLTPALIDYDRWVDDRARTSLAEQIQLMERNIRYHRGRIHPYFPFDPWRETEDPEGERGSLYWLKEAIEKNGFVGAKLYPPMGYCALGNTDLTTFPKNAPQPHHEFGKSLDAAMRSLFSYCQENDIPILTHCANSNETERNFGERAAPRYWAQAVADSEFPKLRVCLGHYGGLGSLERDNGWAWQVGALCNDPDKNVYADVSHYSGILQKDTRRETMDNLKRLFDTFPNAINRIMFGTDWIMLARVRKFKEFLDIFERAFKDRFGDENCRKFMGQNAVRFLGLAPGERTRARLDGFYRAREMPLPAWTRLV